MPSQLAARGASGAGRRRALVRAREPEGRRAVRRLRRRSQPGLPRRLRRDAGREAGRGHDGGQVLLYNGDVADTLFSSSTGGWTQSAADAFGSPGRPYLVSVRDPYDSISPYHDWGPVPVPGTTLAKAVGVVGRVLDATVKRNPSRRVKTLKVTSLSRGYAAHGHRRRRRRRVGARRSARRGSASAFSRCSRRRRILRCTPARESRLTGVVRGVTAPSCRDPSPVRHGRSSGRLPRPAPSISRSSRR